MKLHSTSDRSLALSFAEAVYRGMGEDGGLYMPTEIPRFPPDFFRSIGSMSFPEISFEAAKLLLDREVPHSDLRRIVEKSITFPAPLRALDEQTAALELFHGPTLAFKDFGARFMAGILEYLHRNERGRLTVLVATSGDTGSAVARGFFNAEGISVVLLYPSGKVSAIQELQLTTQGGNVVALEIDGTFDDCQRLVKRAFADRELSSPGRLTSANSINVARLIPQTFYYFNGFAQLPEKKRPVVFSVPSGNLGNLTAGLIAAKMGLPVRRFIAAANANDALPRFLETGVFAPAPTKATISNAMDVGNPSNFARIFDLFDGNLPAMREALFSTSVSDDETRSAIREAHDRHGYVLDPHGAVAFLALKRFRDREGAAAGIILETAHPAKFPEAYAPDMKESVPIPQQLQNLRRKAKRSVRMSGRYDDLKAFLKETK